MAPVIRHGKQLTFATVLAFKILAKSATTWGETAL
jgi:hypothetical protein